MVEISRDNEVLKRRISEADAAAAAAAAELESLRATVDASQQPHAYVLSWVVSVGCGMEWLRDFELRFTFSHLLPKFQLLNQTVLSKGR
jgi:hypothetical protein